jgi:dTDP-4-dehydrorhamnose 3,5-epimerase
VELGEEGNRCLWVPAGFAHGFCALTDEAVVAYKVSGYWSPGVDAGVRFNDPAIGVKWPVAPSEAQVSAKDAALPLLSQL